MSTIEELVYQCIENNIPVTSCTIRNNKLAYTILIGSKTGEGTLCVTENNNIILETRYKTFDFVNSFKEISDVAFRWFLSYKTSDIFSQPEDCWASVWLAEGRIKESTQIKYDVL